MPVPRVALVPSEPIRPHMAGAGIRYFELARRLPAFGLEVVLINPGDLAQVPVDELPGVQVRRFERKRLAELTEDCDVAVSQGQLCNDLVVKVPELPLVVDLHDPFLAEHLHYAEALGLGPFLNDHATWVMQMWNGDFFLCASEEQRDYYLGFLTAVGRVHPPRMAHDPDPGSLVAVVPYGVPEELPPFSPLLPQRAPGEKRLLFGGLYDWYDPWPVLEALEAVDEPSWTLIFIRNPNPQTPQKLLGEVEAWCRQRGWWGERVKVIDWVPAERRYDLWRDVDLLVATHDRSLETRLSLRIRFLDALVAGCSVVTNEGGAISRLLREYDAGWVVPSKDPAALARAYRQALSDGALATARRRAAEKLLEAFSWDRSLAPLVAFCHRPRADPTKRAFHVRPPWVIPPDHPRLRLRRLLRRIVHLDLGFGIKGWLRRHGLLR